VRIIVDGQGDTPSVSIGPFVSETDEAERDREKQETRRLLYVALTRARDRLYLSSPVKDGMLAPGRGSLAEVLPDSIKELFSRAAAVTPTQGDTIISSRLGARTYDWRVCRTD
jgi:ATP-dependent exoDNAse (exonuclease V) beta subunit